MIQFDAKRWFFLISLPFLILQTIFSLFYHTPSVSIPVHDTYFIVARSMIWFSLFFFLNFVAIIYWTMEKMHLQLHKGLSKIHFWITVLSLLILIFGMVISRFFIVSDSTNVKEVLFDFVRLTQITKVSVFLLIFGQILFIFNCMLKLIKIR
jgi:heme/copper-type cytochrome/quinol oxidase subunit 1